MITKEIVDHIKAQLKAGKNERDIRQELSDVGGWTTEDIHEAFVQAANTPDYPIENSQNNTTVGVICLSLFLIVPILASGWYTFMGLFGCGLGVIRNFSCTYLMPVSCIGLIMSLAMGLLIVNFYKEGRNFFLPAIVYILGIAPVWIAYFLV